MHKQQKTVILTIDNSC